MSLDFGNGDANDLPVGKAAVNRLIQENSDLFSDSNCKVCSAVLISESQKLAHYQSKKHANKFRLYMSAQQGEDATPAKKMKTNDAAVASLETDRNKYCPICNMSFSAPVVANSHYEGKTHAKNLKLKEQCGVSEEAPPSKKPAPGATPSATPKTPVVTDESDPDQFCQLCKATFNNPQMAQQHYMGKRHKKHETKSKLMTIYTSSGNALPQKTPLKAVKPGTGPGPTGNGFSCDTCNIVVNSIEQYQAHISGSKHKNNLNSMVTTSADRLSPSSDRKSFGGISSSNRRYSSDVPYAGSSFSSSTSVLPSSGYYSSSGGLPSSSGGLPSLSGGLSSSGGLPSFSGGFSKSGGYPSSGGFPSSSSSGGFPSSSSSGGFPSSSSGGFPSSSSSGGFPSSSSSGGFPSSSSSGGFPSSSSGGFPSSSGGFSSSSRGFSSSSGGFSSSGTLSSSRGLSSVGRYSGGESLLRPSYASETYAKKDMSGPDGYNYFNQGY